MYYVEKSDLKRMETMLYRHGLTGGCSVVPVTVDNVQVKKDVHYLYSNKNITIRFYYARLENGMWYDLIGIDFENIENEILFKFRVKQEQERKNKNEEKIHCNVHNSFRI